MSKIPVGKTGRILSGDNVGLQVRVIDDSENTGGFLILLSRDFSVLNSEAFDDWVQSQEMLEAYFEESGWQIEWF